MSARFTISRFMISRFLLLGLISSLVITLGCAPTSQDKTSLPLFVTGTDESKMVVTRSGAEITLDRADLAFGPLVLCAGTTAGELCEVARLEWLDTVVVNTLDSTLQQAGELSGVTGPVRSWMYDLGISSQLTSQDPFVLGAARELGGYSLVIEGRALVDEIELPFSASIPVQQTDDTELGVPVVRKSLSDQFFRDVAIDERGLTIRFDPADWIRNLDLSSYVGRQSCTADGPSIACDGTQEYTCEDEMTTSQRDCADLNQVCLPQQGCADMLEITSESQQYRALRNAILSGVRPSFTWRD